MLYNIQLLRYISALLVLFAHLIVMGIDKFDTVSISYQPYAHYMMIGVDIFFVISGFIIYYTSRRRDDQAYELKNSIKFFAKRIFRIYPVYWLLSLPLIPLLIYLPTWVNSGAEQATSVIHSMLLLPHPGPTLLPVGWTLEFEMFFYLIFALTLFAGRRQVPLMFVLFTSLITAGLFITEPSSAFLELATSSLLGYFVAGFIIGYIYEKLPHSKLAISITTIAWLGSLLYLFSSYYQGLDTRFIHFGPTAILTVLLALLTEKRGWVFYPKFSQLGGDISYALYLLHLLVISAVGRIWMTYAREEIPYSVICVIMVIASLIGSALIHQFFERPINNYGRRLLNKKLSD